MIFIYWVIIFVLISYFLKHLVFSLIEIPSALSQRYLFFQQSQIPISCRWTLIHRTTELSYESPCARFGHSMTRLGSRVFVFGGKTEAPKNRRYSSKSSSILLSVSPTRSKLSAFQFCLRLFNQDLWILHKPKENHIGEWVWSSPLCNGVPPTPRTSHRAVAVGSHLIIFGGYTNRYSNEFSLLCSSTFTWTILNFSPSLQEQIPQSSNSLQNKKKRKSTPFRKRRYSFIKESSSSSSEEYDAEDECQRYLLRKRRKVNFNSGISIRNGYLYENSLKRTKKRSPLSTKKLNTKSQLLETRSTHQPIEPGYPDPSLLLHNDRSPASSSDSILLSASGHIPEPCNSFPPVADSLQFSSTLSHFHHFKYIPKYFLTVQSDLCPNCQSSSYVHQSMVVQCPKSLSEWMVPRMEASLIYNECDNTIIVFGGSTRFRWDHRQLRYLRSFTSCLVIVLSFQV